MDFLENLAKALGDAISADLQKNMDEQNPVVEIPQQIQTAVMTAVFREIRLSQAISLLGVVIEANPEHARALAILCRDGMIKRDCCCSECKALMLKLQGVIVGDSN